MQNEKVLEIFEVNNSFISSSRLRPIKLKEV
jgi:hypothetical protein